MLKTYVAYLKAGFKNMFDYKADFLFLNIGPIVNLFVMYFIFKYVYGFSGFNSSYSFDKMKIYIVLASSTRTVFDYGLSRSFKLKIRNNIIINDYLTPGGLIEKNLAYSMGNLLAIFVISFFMVFIISLLILKVKIAINIGLAFFFINIFLGGIIFNLVESFISIFSLYNIETSGYLLFHKLMFLLFSGVQLPLFLYPGFFNWLASFLPYRYILYEPILTYIELKNPFTLILVQVSIIFIMFLATKLVFYTKRKSVIL